MGGDLATEITIAADSPASGQRLGDVPWPASSVPVTMLRSGRLRPADPGTLLRAGDRSAYSPPSPEAPAQQETPLAADPPGDTAALTTYARRHPRAWAALRPAFEATLGARIDSDGTTLPMIALDLTESAPHRAV